MFFELLKNIFFYSALFKALIVSKHFKHTKAEVILTTFLLLMNLSSYATIKQKINASTALFAHVKMHYIIIMNAKILSNRNTISKKGMENVPYGK